MSHVQTTDPQQELFDVVNENDEVIGEATRAEVHKDLNLIYRVVHTWILNDKGEILLQQRSMTKDLFPGFWDISCAGHVKKGHAPLATAERELVEELGISAKCEVISKYLIRMEKQSAFINLYLAYHNGLFTVQKEEVDQVKFFTKNEALEFIKTDPKASYFAKKEIPMVFEFVEKKYNA